MTEILYCPILNELLLFEGKFEFTGKTVTVFVASRKKLGMKINNKVINVNSLVHIGWL